MSLIERHLPAHAGGRCPRDGGLLVLWKAHCSLSASAELGLRTCPGMSAGRTPVCPGETERETHDLEEAWRRRETGPADQARAGRRRVALLAQRGPQGSFQASLSRSEVGPSACLLRPPTCSPSDDSCVNRPLTCPISFRWSLPCDHRVWTRGRPGACLWSRGLKRMEPEGAPDAQLPPVTLSALGG